MIIHLERPKKYAAEREGTLSTPSVNSKPNTSKPSPIVLAIHGGAGGTIPPNMPPAMEAAYRERLRAALSRGYEVLQAGHSALDAVCRAVVELENDPLFNAARGAVFDRAGQNQCEASVMIAGPALTTVTGVNLPTDDPEENATTEKNHARPPRIASNRRTAAVTLVRQTKNPILLARALYLHPSCAENVLFSGEEAEKLGWQLGCGKVERSYYWTRRRWLEHRRDLGLPDDDDTAHKAGDAEGETIPPPYASHDGAAPTFEADVAEQLPDEEEHDGASSHPSQSGKSSGYDADADSKSDFLSDLPKGTVGAVALDSSGRLACATSTGGKTNKFPGRIGDTPSVGAGYWAEVWDVEARKPATPTKATTPSRKWTFFSCLSGSAAMDVEEEDAEKTVAASAHTTSAGVAISGTGDGDYFQRTSFASLVAHRMRLLGESADVASKRALEELTTVAGVGTGGAIVLDAQGKVSFPLNSATMNRGVISSETGAVPRVAIFSTEQCE